MRCSPRIARSGSILALAALAAGCGYGFSSSLLPGHIRSVAIPLMENRTSRGDLATVLADSLSEAFIDDNTLKVVDEKDADSIVEGAIVDYRRSPFQVDSAENVQAYKVELLVEARFVDVRKNKVIWEETITQWDTYRIAGSGAEAGPETEQDGIGRVLAKLTADILNRTVQGW